MRQIPEPHRACRCPLRRRHLERRELWAWATSFARAHRYLSRHVGATTPWWTPASRPLPPGVPRESVLASIWSSRAGGHSEPAQHHLMSLPLQRIVERGQLGLRRARSVGAPQGLR
jgi:hypothetical protein